MKPEPFDENLSSNRPPAAVQGSSEIPPNIAQHKAKAVVNLLRGKGLSHTFGEQGEYEVCTTLMTRQAWRYQCSVLRHGRVLKRTFPPIKLDRTRDMRKAGEITEEMRIAFATEAVDIHFTRCAAVQEYLVLASIFSEPPPRNYRPLQVTMAILMCVALVAVYWFWQQPILQYLKPPPVKAPPHLVQWERREAFYTHPAGEPFAFPLPALNGASRNSPVEVSMDSSNSRPGWIQFDRERLRIRGTAPMAGEDRTYQLLFLAKADGSQVSRLHVYLTFTGPKESPQALLLPPSIPSSAAPQHQDSSVESQSPPEPPPLSPAPNPLQGSDCLIKILKGEPC